MRSHSVLAILGTLVIAAPAWAIPEGPAPNTPEWLTRESENYAKTIEAPVEQAGNAQFQVLWHEVALANDLAWIQRALDDPSWLDPRSGNTQLTPLATQWGSVATGDPTRYPESPGPNGTDFYASEGELVPVVFYDRGCARISGRVWAPRGWTAGDATLPGVVIQNGSVQAPETLYWWAAQALVRAGYVVMTFDPRGQGRSDFQTPTGEQGGNLNSEVFFSGMVDAIDFFRATPGAPYPHNVTCAGTYPTVVTHHNPFHDRVDPTRLGITGHSLGASGVSAVQGYPGDRFMFPDPDGTNPVDVVVAWDSLGTSADGPPRVPAMGQSGEYGLTPVPFTAPPDPEDHKDAYHAYRAAGIPVYQLTVRGSTHYEWSLLPSFPTTSWCPDMSTGSCLGGFGNPIAEHYTVAWMDRWLKLPGEPGYGDADARLLVDDDWCDRLSFYFRSARAFPDRAGVAHLSEDLRAECVGGPTPVATPTGTGPTPTAPTPTPTPEDPCGAAAAVGCRQAVFPGKGVIHIRDRAPDSRDRLIWKWLKGAATTKAAFGAPLSSTDYAFCLYDGTGGLVASAEVPANGLCDGKPCWKENRKGYKYRKRGIAPGGRKNTFQLILESGGDGQAKIIVNGKAGVPETPRLPMALPVTAQLVHSDGACWEATFSSPALRNRPDQFKGKSD